MIEVYMAYEFEVPLFFRVNDEPGNGGYPEVYPFRLTEASGIPRQASSPGLKEILRKIYSRGLMMVGSMDGDDLAGNLHAVDCLAFTCDSLGELRGRHVLEVGCGRGVVLKQLASRGAQCVGLEPGAQIVGAKDAGVQLINDFFPSPQIAGEKFDAITSYNVIEHIEELEPFLEGVKECLADGGDFIFCVPNCGPYIAAGDISILLHEHYNYFTEGNVAGLLGRAGFVVKRVSVSKNTALLLVHARKGAAEPLPEIDTESRELDAFIHSMHRVQRRLDSSMSRFEDHEIAVYCPNRALNFMSLIGRRMVRPIEDTPSVLGKYYPFFGRSVENFDALRNYPAKAVYVFSFTHGEQLRSRCLNEPMLQTSEVHVISDFY